ncbi:ABC transporter ATP-binding protein [Orientia tsutsugamushi]|uniref:ABC transporter ATP-binding protein n=1 Tax=Orientia tsutsugamushi TaxID=784 RepID=UPI0007E4D13D|nr:ABC transporter ATP-binding protein [Orientia tsutsugamushi]
MHLMSNYKILHLFLKYLQPYRFKIFIVLISLIMVSGSLLYVGSAIKLLIDHNCSCVNIIMAQISITIVIFSIFSFLRSFTINSISENLILDIRSDLFKHLLKLRISTFAKLKVTDINNRLLSNINNIGELINNLFSFILRNSIMFLGSLMLMFAQSNKFTYLVIIMFITIALPMIKIGHYIRTLAHITQFELLKIHSKIDESFNNIKLIYAFNQQSHQVDTLNTIQREYFVEFKRKIKLRSMFFALTMALVISAITFIIWLGSNDIAIGVMSSGDLTSFLYYAIVAVASLGGVIESFAKFPGYFMAAEKVFSLFEIDSIESNLSTSEFNNGVIKFNNVSFSYPSRPNIAILSNCSLSIAPGQFVGIVGKSGAGKSTILQLLIKFYDPTTGTIQINNVDISSVHLPQLRKNFSYIPQETYIFSDTIKNNILFSNQYASMEDIAYAIQVALIDEFLTKMPDGLNSFIGEKGNMLSGGQKQRLAIARGLITKAPVMLLDEATNAIDSKTEKIILNNLRSISPQKTIIVVTHRISAIEQADNIIVLDNGKVNAQGNHAELMQHCQLYKELIRRRTNSSNCKA